ncbi:tetratricopeptide repeat protein [Campylobacter ureolyticus]|uniref:Tetratricopeptide repeat protein n=1 Tax=Campylobacter ureolyticus TaxID=827 RepID=A0A9Q4PSM3_9BACT|nr:tetratricopeptide repeat protein [Campylobacter ureolyticus]MCZ6160147.1 tetratricopeptide repeat protein [Campylobacter ureolyticus]MCZ6163936.1 tetratricopeptide repeat protein [Campylobacter ureolyticus]MCZ6165905.1 tetratricopeptide repeat protein [Campylobacter ureolyticus]
MRYYTGFILSILGIILILFFKYPEFSTISKAKESFNLKDYKKAAEFYNKIERPKAKYNEGVANYKDGNFSQALQNFKDVKDDNLSFERLHNLGNTYANLHDFNKSILSYEKALKIKEDNETRFNLELIKKIQDQNKTQNNQNSDNNKEQNQDKNQNSNQNSDKNSKQNSQNSKDENEQNENQQNSDKQNSEKNEQQNDKQNDNKSNENQEDKNNQETEQNNDKEENKNNQENEQSDDKQENKQNENNNIAQKSIENEQKEDENKENQNVGKQVENKKDDKIDEIPADIKPISDMEEAKWQKALEHRNIGTFLMPIGERDHKSEDKNVKPW